MSSAANSNKAVSLHKYTVEGATFEKVNNSEKVKTFCFEMKQVPQKIEIHPFEFYGFPKIVQNCRKNIKFYEAQCRNLIKRRFYFKASH